MSQPSAGASPVPTTPPLVSLEAFYGIIWAGFAICVIAFSGRITIRVVCFKTLFLEDWLMLLALSILLAATIVGTLFVRYIFDMVAVSNGATPSPDFLVNTSKGLRGFGALMLLNYIGIWLVKFNFLLFFRRLGNHVNKYRWFWWFVVVFNVAAGATVIGLIDFKCLMPPAEEIFAKCSSPKSVMASYTAAKASCALDAASDGLILFFPFWILWGCKLSFARKFALSGIFGLVAFTIAVTIIRGSIFGGVYKSISENNMKQLNITWIWFWFAIEFIVAFTIGCLVSFRALFAQRKVSRKDAELQEMRRRAAHSSERTPRRFRDRIQLLRDDLLTTFRTWEDTTKVDDGMSLSSHDQPRGQSGDSERGITWNPPNSSNNARLGSVSTLSVGRYENEQAMTESANDRPQRTGQAL